MKRQGMFSPKAREKAVRLVKKRMDSYDSEWAAIRSVAAEFGCAPETLRKWIQRSEAEEDKRLGVTPAERQRRKEFEDALLRLFKPVERLDHEQLLRQPKTVAKRFGDRLGEALVSRTEGRTDQQILYDLASVFPEPTPAERATFENRVDEHVAKERRSVARYRDGAQLLRLMDEAHRSVRNAWVTVTLDPVVDGQARLQAQAKMEAVAGSRGEERAWLLAEAVAYIAEAVYQPYLVRVWVLHHLRRRSFPGTAPAFGTLVNQLPRDIPEYPLILESDAAHVRNAIDHPRRGFEYLPRERAVQLRDKEWTRTLKLSELERMNSRMFQLAAVLFPKALGAFMFDGYARVTTPPFLEYLRAVRNNDPEGREHWVQEFVTARDSLVEDIARLKGSTSPA